MRLESIKLAGFKSFVDPTTVPFPGNLTAVVGPNGCGKSNIIDAVRWVMGESSAKQLRGESLDDVIFNGCTTRKPVGQASIELTFDNSDGTLTGQYASYSHLSLRREITREGQSSYYLNGTRCRRRDIIDIFLGTGLGPRSYAIIEQGMISRVVEAKPEDLRFYVEEAAGISKYKERRRETELRIQHTKDNLTRLNDLRDELDKQLNHLQRQANAAERYKVLKQEERLLKAQIQALRYQQLHKQLASQTDTIQGYETQLATARETQQTIEQQLIEQREQQTEATAHSNEIQTRYYELGNEITKLEQTIHSQQERREQWQRELQELAQTETQTQQQLQEAAQQQQNLTTEGTELAPQLEQAKLAAEQSQLMLKQAELSIQEWQTQWDAFNQETAQATQQVQVEQTSIQHLEQRLQTIQQRITRLEQEHQQQTSILTSDASDDLEQRLAQLHIQHGNGEQQLQTVLKQIAEQREVLQRATQELDAAKNQLQTLHGQQASLEALQQAALGQTEEATVTWLKQQGLADAPRLAQILQVETGWEQAVETVLDRYLQGVCIDDLKSLGEHLAQFQEGNLSIIVKSSAQHSKQAGTHGTTLISKINAPWSLEHLLSDIYVAENVTEALALINKLSHHESVITRDGIWLGNGWAYVAHHRDTKAGVIQRERELQTLKNTLAQAQQHVATKQAAVENAQTHLRELEESRAHQQQKLAELIASQAELRAQQQVKQARFNQAEQRAQQINLELQDCTEQLATDQELLSQTQQTLQAAQQNLQQLETQRANLLQTKNTLQTALDTARQQAKNDQDTSHQLALRLQAAQLQLETTIQTQQRLQQQSQELGQRKQFLNQALNESEQPLAETTQQLTTLTSQRQGIETQLNQARQQVEALEHQLRELEQQRHTIDQTILNIRNELEQVRLNGQELQVRAKTLQEQLTESGYELETVINELPPEANETTWEEQYAQTTRRIDRLGPINLAAIDEYQTLAERKNYLDAQNNDLIDALKTLEDAINKMDEETRARFKETFDKINEQFQTLFPRLFGGGRAFLQIEGDDLLSAGISIMAQPPGKRNSTIHLLSGGEKALTATALVFSFFQLNPAPFCMLDEVDAPLDDANVMRFCKLVKEMSDKIQFIFISHNKLAIEMAHHLAGVTMHEAGVSRMVAVDVEQAMAMAEA